MPRDISGVYTLPLPDVTTSTVTSSAWANTTLSDIALALTQSLSINGSVTPAKLTDDEAGFQTKFGVDEALATAEARLTFLESCAASQIGDIEPFAMGAVPFGYLECTGAAISRVAYGNLFAVVGAMFGPGDGSTTFNLPELRGESVKGAAVADTPGTMQAGQVGAHAHTATAANSTTHTHTATTSSDGTHAHTATAANSASHTHTETDGTTGTNSANHTHSWSDTTSSAGAHTHTVSVSVAQGANSGYAIITGPGSAVSGSTSSGGAHTHTASGTTSAAAAHSHALSGTTAGGGAHNHTVTLVNSVAHTHTFSTSESGSHSHTVTVNSAGGEGQVRNVAVMYCIRYRSL
jgi:microcystin-dependent protein